MVERMKEKEYITPKNAQQLLSKFSLSTYLNLFIIENTDKFTLEMEKIYD